ncbi:MAG TPA: sulfur carrier protein ThiS [Nitrospiraceae bacterium]|nr:sulfur carrier protein ThiS [Nitrospiraceae bacterium]
MTDASPDTSIHIQVNGERQTAPSGSTVAGLLKQLDIRSERVAVEVNLQIVDRQNFERQSLQDGDRVEIISFIGGGSEVVRENWMASVLAARRISAYARSMRAGEASPNSPLY